MSVVFQGILTTTTPLHIASADSARINEGQLVYGEKAKGKPFTRVTRMPSHLNSPLVSMSGDEPKEYPFAELPVINGNTLRGRLRREMAGAVLDSLVERGETISLDLLHILTCGAATGAPSGNMDIEYELVKAARENLYSGVWGGGPDLFRSGVNVFSAVPVMDLTIENNFVPNNMITSEVMIQASARNLSLRTLGTTYPIDMYRIDDALAFRDPIFEKVVTDYESEIRAWQEVTGEQTRKRKSDNSEKKLDLRNMIAVEAVMPGVSFFIHIECKEHLTDAQIGYLALGLERVKMKQGLGGMLRAGMGRFNLDVQMYETHDFGKTLDLVDNEVQEDMIRQAKEGITSLTEQDLLAVYSNKKKKAA